MGIFDKLFRTKEHHDAWTATHRGILYDVSYEDLCERLGQPQKAKGGFVFWRQPLTSLDLDYSESEFFQLSNQNFSGFGVARKIIPDADVSWYALGTSEKAIRLLAEEVGSLARNVETSP